MLGNEQLICREVTHIKCEDLDALSSEGSVEAAGAAVDFSAGVGKYRQATFARNRSLEALI